MKTENELIAEFMGLKFQYEANGIRYYDVPKGQVHSHNASMGVFIYDKSWDWLMPVVEKINKLFDEAFPPGDEFVKRILAHEEPIEREYMDVVGLPISSTIDEVYHAVLTFIKWYNENKAGNETKNT